MKLCYEMSNKSVNRLLIRIIPVLVPGKIMEQILLEARSRHMKEKKMTGNSQHGLTNGKSCLTSLIDWVL